jgi:hypothetical protein
VTGSRARSPPEPRLARIQGAIQKGMKLMSSASVDKGAASVNDTHGTGEVVVDPDFTAWSSLVPH